MRGNGVFTTVNGRLSIFLTRHKRQRAFVKHSLILIFCSILSANSSASDLDREKRLADNIRDSIIVGELVSLQTNDGEFISLINNEEPDKPRGSVIILHGMGSNPNAPDVIYPLRSQLAKLGWVTAAIQLPVLATGASIDEYLKLIPSSESRIQASLDYMRENFKNRPCILVAHSLGAMMAINFMAKQKKLACDALVLIGLPTLPSDLPEAQSLELMKAIKTPTLDIFGSQDLDSVKGMAATRKLTLIKNNPLNRQVEISGANHNFNGLGETLVRSIHGWLMHSFKLPEN